MFRKKYNDRSETWSKESLEKQSLDIRYIDFTSTLQLRERKTIVLFVNDLSTRWRYPQFFHSHAKKVVMPRIKKMSTNEREVLFSISKMQSYRNLFELLSFFWRGFSFFFNWKDLAIKSIEFEFAFQRQHKTELSQMKKRSDLKNSHSDGISSYENDLNLKNENTF